MRWLRYFASHASIYERLDNPRLGLLAPFFLNGRPVLSKRESPPSSTPRKKASRETPRVPSEMDTRRKWRMGRDCRPPREGARVSGGFGSHRPRAKKLIRRRDCDTREHDGDVYQERCPNFVRRPCVRTATVIRNSGSLVGRPVRVNAWECCQLLAQGGLAKP